MLSNVHVLSFKERSGRRDVLNFVNAFKYTESSAVGIMEDVSGH